MGMGTREGIGKLVFELHAYVYGGGYMQGACLLALQFYNTTDRLFTIRQTGSFTIRQTGSLQHDRPAPYSCGACGLRACRWVWGFTLREPHTGLGYRLHYVSVSDGHGVCLEALPEFLWMVYLYSELVR